ncbi:TraX family protein [Halomonas sp. HG01]|uniref:TraX family protein n=1 Tax=Halomonas sp. HG01 TaxID=1609967 RepID=UPI0006145F5A|nr:TraX family protein [Halomonas sp. HG01]
MNTTAIAAPAAAARVIPGWLPLVQGIAIVTMAIDHVSLWLPAGDVSPILRVTLGRVALPLFCFMVAWHALHTADARRYADRILTIALLAQLPFMALHGQPLGNICFTLAAAAYLAAYYRHRDPWALMIGAALAIATFHVEYGPLALGLILAFMLAIRHPITWLVPLIGWPLAQYGLSLSGVSAFLGVCLLLALVSTHVPPIHLPRWLTRWFYPAHLGGIWLLRWLV